MRRVASWVFAVLFAILLPLALVSSWALNTVSNTSQWVETLHPLASDQVVTTYLANEGAKTVVQDLKVASRTSAVLPKGLEFLAPKLTGALQQSLVLALGAELKTKAFQRLWDSENRLTHETALRILDGRAVDPLSHVRSLEINITPFVLSAIGQLDASGVMNLNSLKQQWKRNPALSIQMLDAHELFQVKKYYNLALSLDWLFPVLCIFCAVGVVANSRPYQHGLQRLGMFTIGSSLVAYGLLAIGIATASNDAPTPPKVTAAILNTLTSALAAQYLWASFFGGILLVIAWLTGPSSFARATRSKLRLTNFMSLARWQRTMEQESH